MALRLPGAASALLSAWQAMLLLGSIDTALKYIEYRNVQNYEHHQQCADARCSQNHLKEKNCEHYMKCGDDVHSEQCNKCQVPERDNQYVDAMDYEQHKGQNPEHHNFRSDDLDQERHTDPPNSEHNKQRFEA